MTLINNLLWCNGYARNPDKIEDLVRFQVVRLMENEIEVPEGYQLDTKYHCPHCGEYTLVFNNVDEYCLSQDCSWIYRILQCV